MENWSPTSDNEKEFREAFLKLQNSTNDLILTPAPGEDGATGKRFLLQGRSYFALKAYVMTGKGFPTTEAMFDTQIPPECFLKLTKVDSEIHAQTKTGLVKMGSSCSEFYDKSLYRIIDAGTLAVTWSEQTLNLLKHTTNLNLYDQLMVLLDTKYRKLADRDEKWTDANSAAEFILEELIKAADKGKTEAEAIRGLLLKFRDTTQGVLPWVQTLITKYEKGPVANSGTQNKPYLAYLNEDLAKVTKQMKEDLWRSNDTYDKWITATGLAIGVGVSFGWIPIFGWVPLAFTAKNAATLRESWVTLWESYNELIKHNKDEEKLIEFVQSMVKQWDGILVKMDGAIQAVTVLVGMFQEQSECYILIKAGLSRIEAATEAGAGIRKACIENAISETITKVTELQAAGRGFIKAIINDNPDPVFGVPTPAA
ncbi:hypothetical protein BDN72DRAFT_897216 [Pluteus cervinus]|uniref:Uncharacterized protein n=1 Tax=Pluteus cervinus TaxID=181527 RepID=A0ACD3AX34_9AGAR|nr:hypothetical protein BDN72DRAFT_897216 [Pluteus cervinus]